MSTILLTWNPANYPWNIASAISTINQGNEYKDEWNCCKSTQKGDRFFLLQVGNDKRGIIGSGTVESEPEKKEHWKPDKASKGETRYYVDIRFSMLKDQPIFSRERLKKELGEFKIVRRSEKLDDETAQKLEKLWETEKDSLSSSKMDFFKQADIARFANISAGGDYDSNNDEQKVAGKEFSEIIYPQIEYWADNVVKRLVDFELYDIIRSWQTHRQFHAAFYVKIHHKDHSDIKVYFTVGVNVVENVLICKLDLPQKQGNDIEIKWSEYWLGKKCNWEKLISETVDFINKYRENYYSAVFDIALNPSQSHGGLIQRKFPTGIEKLPDIKREFKGIDINFNDEQARKNIIGNIGERLVIEFEQQKLKDNNLQHLIPNVAKAKDGCGYDIQSYDQNGEVLFIEVKSTVGDANTPFFISANEVAFHKAQKGKSIIYRVYDIDAKTHQGKFFIISDWEAETISDTVVFRSAPRKKI